MEHLQNRILFFVSVVNVEYNDCMYFLIITRVENFLPALLLHVVALQTPKKDNEVVLVSPPKNDLHFCRLLHRVIRGSQCRATFDEENKRLIIVKHSNGANCKHPPRLIMHTDAIDCSTLGISLVASSRHLL